MTQEKITIGRFGSVYGIKGWLRVISFTDPKENILQYQPWWINKDQQWQQIYVEDGRLHGKDIIIKLPNINDRELAKSYTNIDNMIDQEQLPKLANDEYYRSDLEGLMVIDKSGQELGRVNHLIATGANDVLVLEKNIMIPYIDEVIIKVDLEEKIIMVDWELEL